MLLELDVCFQVCAKMFSQELCSWYMYLKKLYSNTDLANPEGILENYQFCKTALFLVECPGNTHTLNNILL